MGRFGYFWASFLSRYFTVKGYTRSAHRKVPDSVVRVDEDEIVKVPVLFLCVSISALEDVLLRIRDYLSPDTLLLDTCSVKVYPVSLMEKLLPSPLELIATHPMFGPDSARNGLKGLPMIFWPVRAKRETSEYWKNFFSRIGLHVVCMSPEEHDREAAFTQGITHYIGRVISDLKLADSSIGTLGYKKLLEITEQTCNDPWQLFLDLQRYNPYTREMRRLLHQSLEKMLGKLETDGNEKP